MLYTCPVAGCGRTFDDARKHERHMRGHAVPRPFVCEWPDCGKAFPCPSVLETHMRSHTGFARRVTNDPNDERKI